MSLEGRGRAAPPRSVTNASRAGPVRSLRVFRSLDFIYLPSRDVAAEAEQFVASVGASIVFAIEAFGTRVAMLDLGQHSPALLLAGHLEGDQPVLVYRVADLERTVADLGQRGVDVLARFEIPPGPAAEIATPGPQRVAFYELTRPEVGERLVGRRDF